MTSEKDIKYTCYSWRNGISLEFRDNMYNWAEIIIKDENTGAEKLLRKCKYKVKHSNALTLLFKTYVKMCMHIDKIDKVHN